MNPYLRFGLGGEPAAWAALVLAGLLLAVSFRAPSIDPGRRAVRASLALLAAVAALLSWAYILHYLRGGPRIIDSAYYFLQARSLAHGELAFRVPEPLASFHGRFLLQTPEGGLGVLFPPGYPAALAAAFWFGAPLALGPVLAALLVPATYWLGRELGAAPRVALGAAGLGVVCAALRYHTADTMSHGWSALLGVVTLAAAARGTVWSFLVSGFSAGWLCATRPVTGAVLLFGSALLAARAGRKAGWLVVALLPGASLLALHQHALTGSFFGSTQLAYYAVADGPPGCFRYGFGQGIGCVFEHGDYVRARLPDGYGLLEAASNTLRRLGVHALDVGNAGPLALLVPWGAWLTRSERAARIAFGVIVAIILAYAPFYFEASFPGAGARLFADVLPIEHVFIAQALASLGALRFALPLSLAGFALHTHHQHALLRDREGGRPMFEEHVLERARVTKGLVFVSTDHGFALGHDPRQADALTGIVVARRRGDRLDALLWERLGKPETFLYEYAPAGKRSEPRVSSIDLKGPASTRIEAEHLWPPPAVSGGWVYPDYSAEACASARRGLRLEATDHIFAATLRLPPVDRPTHLVLGWVGGRSANRPIAAGTLLDDARVRTSKWQPVEGRCWQSEAVGPLPQGRPLFLRVEGSGLLDYIELRQSSEERR